MEERTKNHQLITDAERLPEISRALEAVEVDLDGLRRLQRTAAGFGGLRAAREPLPICRAGIERTFAHRGAPACVNPDFLLSGSEATYTVTVTRRAEDPRA